MSIFHGFIISSPRKIIHLTTYKAFCHFWKQKQNLLILKCYNCVKSHYFSRELDQYGIICLNVRKVPLASSVWDTGRPNRQYLFISDGPIAEFNIKPFHMFINLNAYKNVICPGLSEETKWHFCLSVTNNFSRFCKTFWWLYTSSSYQYLLKHKSTRKDNAKYASINTIFYCCYNYLKC